MSASSLLNWLRRWKPHVVRLTLDDGEQRELQRPTQGRGAWTVLEEAIAKLQPALIEALGADGKTVINSRTLDTEDEVENDERGHGTTTEIQVTDPHAAVAVQIVERLLPKIAQMICESNDAACQRLAEAWTAGNKQQYDLIKMLSDRLQSVEKHQNTLMQERWNLLMQLAEARSKGDENDELGKIVLGHVLNKNGAANGAPPAPDGSSP